MPTELSAGPKAASGNSATIFFGFRAAFLAAGLRRFRSSAAGFLRRLLDLPRHAFPSFLCPIAERLGAGNTPAIEPLGASTRTKLTNSTIVAIALISGVTPKRIIA